MIRQAISCDICGAEKRQTNHWFVAYEHAGELRVSGWNSSSRLRTGSKHLCGQTCLHKLADDFMERIIARRTQTAAPPESTERALSKATDASLTAQKCEEDFESSARLITGPQPTPVAPRPALRPVAALAPTPERLQAEAAATPLPEPRYTSRNWRAEAWERERERTMQAPDRRSEMLHRRASQA